MRVNDRRAMMAKLLDELYARIDDAVAREIILKNWGETDGKHILPSKLAAVTTLGDNFKGTAVVNIDWMKYFNSLMTLNGCFHGCSEIVSADLNMINTSKIVSLRNVFRGCNNLTELHIEDWDVSHVTDVTGMFAGCSMLKSLDLSKWTLHNLIDTHAYEMYTDNVGMFDGCSSLQSLRTGAWDFSTMRTNTWNHVGLQSFASFFYNCSSLQSIDLSAWKVTELEIVSGMFSGCKSLKSVNLDGWVCKGNVTVISMFQGCTSLEEVSMRWTFQDVCGVNAYMFTNCTAMKKLDISGWKLPDKLDYQFFPPSARLNTIIMDGCSDDDVMKIENMAIKTAKIYQDAHVWAYDTASKTWVDTAQ